MTHQEEPLRLQRRKGSFFCAAGLCVYQTALMKMRFLSAIARCLLLAGLFCAMTACEEDSTLQDRILAESALDELSDEVYLFPANNESNSPAVYLPIRKWDLFFVGDVHRYEEVPYPELSNLVIPGKYNHMLVYVGKDADGYAYAVELNIGAVSIANYTVRTTGRLSLLCIGTDRNAETHPSGQGAHKRDHYGIRWAKTFTPSAHAQLMSRDGELLVRLTSDLRARHPYQLQFSVPILEFLEGQRSVQLIDDGFEGGSSCAEYWVSLFETYAGVCIKGSRMNSAQLIRYFRTSAEGRAAYLPAALNPLGAGNLPVGKMIADGVITLRNPPPHVWACDGSAETGIVIPDYVMRSPLLADPAY